MGKLKMAVIAAAAFCQLPTPFGVLPTPYFLLPMPTFYSLPLSAYFTARPGAVYLPDPLSKS